jgi:hypothetical protein
MYGLAIRHSVCMAATSRVPLARSFATPMPVYTPSIHLDVGITSSTTKIKNLAFSFDHWLLSNTVTNELEEIEEEESRLVSKSIGEWARSQAS